VKGLRVMRFEEIYAKYLEPVYSYLKFKLADEYLVEEILQETFLAVYRNLDQLENVKSLKTWILTIAHHKMVDHLRMHKLEEVPLDHHELADEMVTDLTLREVLKQLDPTATTIIYGLYVEQLSCQELAEMLDIPVGTVKSKAYTARTKLRNWLKEVKL